MRHRRQLWVSLAAHVLLATDNLREVWRAWWKILVLGNQHRDFGSWAAKKANPVCCNCLQQGALFKKLACLRDGISVLRRLHLGGECSKASALVLSSASQLVK